MSNLPYSHHAPIQPNHNFNKLAYDADRIGTMTYDAATEAGRIPAAVLLGVLGSGAGMVGASLLSDEENEDKNMLLAGLLGGIGGAAGGYYGADLPTGIPRNSAVDPTLGGQNLPGWLNNMLSFDSDNSLNLGQLTAGTASYADSKLRNYFK